MAEGLHRDGNGKKMNNDGFGKGTASGWRLRDAEGGEYGWRHWEARGQGWGHGTASGNGSTGIGKLGKV